MPSPMQRREAAIRGYFQGWVAADEQALLEQLAPQVRITESHGPVYVGKDEVRQWFREWITHGQVLQWEIHRFFHQEGETIVRWYFCCRYDGHTDGFDGLSLVRFNPEGRIIAIEEYQSRAEHQRLYGNRQNCRDQAKR